jgi:hypothetical protein
MITIATLEGEAPRLHGWWTDVKRSSVGQAISNTGDAITGTAGDIASATRDAYGEYVRPSVSVVTDTGAFVGDVITGDFSSAAQKLKHGTEDTLAFLDRKLNPSQGTTLVEGLPVTDTGIAWIVGGIAAVGGLWYFTRKKRGKRKGN